MNKKNRIKLYEQRNGFSNLNRKKAEIEEGLGKMEWVCEASKGSSAYTRRRITHQPTLRNHPM
jgi:hypothetical protein